MILAALLAAALAQEEIPWSEVRPKRRVKPEFPEAAKALNIEEATCNVRLFIDEKGKPYDVQIDGCPNVYHDSIREAAWQWSFYPVMGPDGQPVKATFTLKIVFRLNDGPSSSPELANPVLLTLGGAWTPPIRPGESPALGQGFVAEGRMESNEVAFSLALGYAAHLPGAPELQLYHSKLLFGPSLSLMDRARSDLGVDALIGGGPSLNWDPRSREFGYGPGFSWQVGLPLTLRRAGEPGVRVRPAVGGSWHVDYTAFEDTEASLKTLFRGGVGIPLQAQLSLYYAWEK